MSKFNVYAQRADTLAKQAFEEYAAAADALKKAEAKSREHPQRSGVVGAEYAAKAARARADVLEAQEKMRQVRRDMDGYNDDVRSIRKELTAALADEYAAKPEDVDAATLELLKSGILKSHEYARLMNTAAAAGNTTMMRIISQYATVAAEEVSEKYGASDRAAQELRVIAHQGSTDPASSKLEQFDALADVFRRTMRNVAMIPSWDQLTANIVENF